MPPQPEKHLPYFEVMEALQAADACVVCWQVAKATRARIESLLYESVTDRGVSEQLRQSHGYCRRHTELLIATGDALGVGILHRPVLEAWMTHLEDIAADPPYRFIGQGRESEWTGTSGCPFCVDELAHAIRTAVTITEWMDDEALAKAMAAAPPFCPAHFQAVLVRCKTSKSRVTFLESERSKIRALHAELEALISSFNHDTTDALPDKSKDSWARAARLLANARRPPPTKGEGP